MPILLVALLLGIVEGVTEFLPISSTGHLIVAERLTNFKDVKDMFTVIVQLGAIAAVVWFYRHDLWDKTVGFFKRTPEALNFWKLLVIGTIPAGIAGLILEKSMNNLTKPSVVAWSMIIGGIILWLVDRRPSPRRTEEPAVENITTRQALMVGVGQCLAIIPGVSRSGATIITGLGIGLNRPTATAFSFYLSIPVMVLASGLKIVKHPDAISQLSGGPAALIIGLIAAFVTALASITWLLRYVSRHNFKPFAYYRIAAGLLILWLVR